MVKAKESQGREFKSQTRILYRILYDKLNEVNQIELIICYCLLVPLCFGKWGASNFSSSLAVQFDYHAEDCEAAEDDEPEPEEDVDLLVDDVDRQNADRVVRLNTAGRTVLVLVQKCLFRKFI